MPTLAVPARLPRLGPKQVFICKNGINANVFRPDGALKRAEVLSEFTTVPYPGSIAQPLRLPTVFDRVVLFVGKFAPVKRIDCLLKAAVAYEATARKAGLRVATLIVGSGPVAAQRLYQDLAASLGVSGVYFIGPHPHSTLARLYNIADVGVFPSKLESFSLVSMECLACGTPIVGTNSGGNVEFTDSSVGALVTDFDSDEDFTRELGATVARALVEHWKPRLAAAAVRRAKPYTVDAQAALVLQHALGC